jgi:hyperosmotically inducible protein
MKKLTTCSALFAVAAAAGALAGCASAPAQSPDISVNLRHSLDQAGLKNVSMRQDRDKGVITLGGNVAADNDKAQAESLAVAVAGGQVVANQIAVLPAGAESDTKAMNTDLDQGIGKNLDAALILNKLEKEVRFVVRSGVVTLNGDVGSESLRTQAQGIAAAVPNVQQVVNELQVKNQKATSN